MGAFKVVIARYNYLCNQCLSVGSSNAAHGKVYSIQHYMVKFVNDLRQVNGFSLGSLISSTHKTETLLKVVLNGITLSL